MDRLREGYTVRLGENCDSTAHITIPTTNSISPPPTLLQPPPQMDASNIDGPSTNELCEQLATVLVGPRASSEEPKGADVDMVDATGRAQSLPAEGSPTPTTECGDRSAAASDEEDEVAKGNEYDATIDGDSEDDAGGARSSDAKHLERFKNPTPVRRAGTCGYEFDTRGQIYHAQGNNCQLCRDHREHADDFNGPKWATCLKNRNVDVAGRIKARMQKKIDLYLAQTGSLQAERDFAREKVTTLEAELEFTRVQARDLKKDATDMVLGLRVQLVSAEESETATRAGLEDQLKDAVAQAAEIKAEAIKRIDNLNGLYTRDINHLRQENDELKVALEDRSAAARAGGAECQRLGGEVKRLSDANAFLHAELEALKKKTAVDVVKIEGLREQIQKMGQMFLDGTNSVLDGFVGREGRAGPDRSRGSSSRPTAREAAEPYPRSSSQQGRGAPYTPRRDDSRRDDSRPTSRDNARSIPRDNSRSNSVPASSSSGSQSTANAVTPQQKKFHPSVKTMNTGILCQKSYFTTRQLEIMEDDAAKRATKWLDQIVRNAEEDGADLHADALKALMRAREPANWDDWFAVRETNRRLSTDHIKTACNAVRRTDGSRLKVYHAFILAFWHPSWTKEKIVNPDNVEVSAGVFKTRAEVEAEKNSLAPIAEVDEPKESESVKTLQDSTWAPPKASTCSSKGKERARDDDVNMEAANDLFGGYQF